MFSIRFNYLVIQNQSENSKYIVVDDIQYHRSKRRWLVLEDTITGIQKQIPIGYYCGRKRLIISENIIKDSDNCSPRYIVAHIYDSVIAVENDF